MHVSQPSVSKVLRHAESIIGFQLFRIVRGRLVPTAEAHVLFQEACELHGRVESLRETTRNLRRGGEGHLRLAVLPSLGLGIAPAAVAHFRTRNPDVSFDIKTLHNEDILRSLYERNSDLAMSYDAPRHPRLAEIVVGSGELVLLYRKKDLPEAPERISSEMLQDLNLIRLTGPGWVGSLFSSKIHPSELSRAGISVQTYYVAAALVRRGAGFAVVDEYTARESVGEDLDFRPLLEPTSFNVYCIHLEDRPLTGMAREFVDVLKKVLVTARP